jgi:hypothetical protein
MRAWIGGTEDRNWVLMRISEVERKESHQNLQNFNEIRRRSGREKCMGKTGNASFDVKCNYRDAYGRTG